METYEELERMEDVPVIFADSSGVISSVNDCFLSTFKWEREKLIGQLLTVIMPPKFRDSHTMGLSRFMTTEQRTLPEHALELEVICGDGTPIKSSHTIVAARQNEGWSFAGKIVPL